MNAPVRRRMPAEQRRTEVIAAAVAAFADRGYAGTTTDDVARLAGVSQPYVVRMFGTKQALFLAAHAETMRRLEQAFRDAVAAAPAGQPPMQTLGIAYRELIVDRSVLRVMQHGFMLGGDPVVGPQMRRAMTSIFVVVRELTGDDDDAVASFLATGMMINVMITLEMSEHVEEEQLIARLLACVMK
ncbi:TetR/AcrR family transcriptional regulator [Pseudonocardia sp. TRM90224]|uniref:TetR/AcrR family transcriptional regulator n=1 Tax=Pseudonocardia sp. TRM90224 TaxID=2812678 RepID=UPI001E57F9D4|nr:TetR/AcrR family transcriptional regulator [Pseudonocardia sp. TRM90224]